MPIYPEEFYSQPFAEQLEFLRRRVPLPAQSLRGVGSEYHDWAFSVSGVTSADFINYLFGALNAAIEAGADYDAFVGQLESDEGGQQVLDRFRDRHLRVVFDTNLRRSHSAGRHEQMAKPHIRRLFVGRQWLHRDSPDFRPHHKAIDLKVFPADAEFWQRAAPPCGYFCRCATRLLTRNQIAQMGLQIENPPDWRTIAEPPFTRAAGLSNARQRAEFIQQGIDRQPPELQAEMRRQL